MISVESWPLFIIRGLELSSLPTTMPVCELLWVSLSGKFLISCNGVAGVADLAHTYPAAVRFLDAQRHNGAPLRYELVWLDNGGAPSVVDDFVARGAQLDRIVRNPTNEGVFRAAAARRSCSASRTTGCRGPSCAGTRTSRRRSR